VTFPFIIDPGLATGVCGILVGMICLLALRRHRLAAATAHAECSARIEKLELRPPAAPVTGRREMRLIAEVSRILALK
jgi:hypothetical protein